MRLDEYLDQIKRLKTTYGDRHYPKERVDLIWEDAKSFPAFVLKKVVDNFIANSRQAPMVREINEALITDREEYNRRESDRRKSESSTFWNNQYASEDVKLIVSMIQSRIRGEVSDAAWKSFMGDLKSSAELQKFKCQTCEDTGLVFGYQSSYEVMWRCQCAAGSMQCADYPTFYGYHRHNATKERPAMREEQPQKPESAALPTISAALDF